MNSKAFYKSKAFWGGISALVAIIGDIATQGFTATNGLALATTAFALYGRVVATAPLAMADSTVQSRADVEQAKNDAQTSNKNWDPDHSN